MYNPRKKSKFKLAVGYGMIAFGVLGLAWVFGIL